MNQTCKVCGEPAAGFHFGAFTCEGCKSFFGRSYNNLSSISECKNSGKCVIDKKNRTTCKACRLRKCYTVGMSKGGSRYGRRSNWFKIHCLLQEQQQQAEAAGGVGGAFGDMAAAAAAAGQQRSPHLTAAQHIGGFLGYPGYLPPEMMQSGGAFLSASPTGRHPAESAAAAAALPFFSMMNALPTIGSPQSAFQLPPHLLFPGYHHHQSAASAAAAADAAYRSELFKHRQSVDSTGSADSGHHFSPSGRPASHHAEEERRPSPELCVSGDEEHTMHASSTPLSHHSPAPPSVPAQHTIHNPVAVRATKQEISSPVPGSQPLTPEPTPPSAAVVPAIFAEHSPMPTPTALSFSVKMQSLSPVSVCSIGAETAHAAGAALAIAQDGPMDLSMKTGRVSTLGGVESDSGSAHSDCSASEEEPLRKSHLDVRRKFYQLTDDQESDNSSEAGAAIKRQKLSGSEAAAPAQGYGGGFGNAATSLRGIFVCV